MKLLSQYRRLHALVQGLGQQPGLPALAEGMHCSERHLRNLLARMQAEGWLSWTAGRGRGHRSELRWHATPDALALDQLGELLREGDLERAFAQLSPAQRAALSARLPEYLAAGPAGGRSLRMPLYRPVQSLDPLDAFSRLEAYLVRQIFARLTEFDGGSERVVPGLAHHWEAAEGARLWHFWLRPGLVFHDGSPLGVEDVAATFMRLRAQGKTYRRLYACISGIELDAAEQRLSFRLSEPHHLWPHCTATANASIVPRQRARSFRQMPVGSGAFRLLRHNAHQLTFGAFKDYYRERPLLDEIDLWVLAPQRPAPGFDLQFGYSADETPAARRIRLSQALVGCNYLVCNPASASLHSVAQRLALADWLAGCSWRSSEDVRHTPASGLLPQWQHRPARPSSNCPLAAGSRLRMVIGPRASIGRMAEDLRAYFEAAGLRLEIRALPVQDWAEPGHFADADLVLAGEVMQHDPQYGCFEWFSADLMLRRWMPAAERASLDAALLRVQGEADAQGRMLGFEAMARRLVERGLALPLSHETQMVEVAPHVAGVRIEPLGFAAFERLWRRAPD